MPALVLFLLGIAAAVAHPARASDFDYYVLSLSWSPSWCAIEGDARGAAQCEASAGHGWVLHGLWPQHDSGWPSYCKTPAPPPTRTMTARMTDIMGNSGLAWHQWRKHGNCTGLSAERYFALSRDAFEAVRRPEVLRDLDQPIRISANTVEAAFLRVNPGWTRDMLTITCREGRIHEARLCLTKDLAPRECGRDVVRDCQLEDAILAPVR